MSFSNLLSICFSRGAQVHREFEFALHRELTDEQNIVLGREFAFDQICQRGMAAQINFHFDVDEKTGEAEPHCNSIINDGFFLRA